MGQTITEKILATNCGKKVVVAGEFIEPKVDSMLRMAIHVKKVDRKVNIKEQKLKTFKRKGFSAVEWGGVIHN